MEEYTGYESVDELIAKLFSVTVQSISDAGLQNREVLFVSDLDA